MSEESQSTWDWLKALLTTGSKLWPVALGFAVIVGLVAVWPQIERLPFKPFATDGRIFVESPEVYTRERLVNDRYEQAFWLEQQLEKLDQSTNFTTARREMALQLAFDPATQAKISELPELSALPFEHEYQIRSALRARIRQALLENQLDDRHDLTGNSVYGLKFDTSVIPGSNTRKRAYVRVTVQTPELPDADLLPNLLGKSLEDVRREGVGALGPDYTGGELSNAVRDFPEHYENWIETIEGSLNSYLDDISDISGLNGAEEDDGSGEGWPCRPFAVSEPDKQRTTDILAESLSKVLAIEERSIYFPDTLFPDANAASFGQVEINLPRPWNRYISVTVADSNTCRNWKHFKVAPLRQYLLVVPDTPVAASGDASTADAEALFQKLYFQVAAQTLSEGEETKNYSVYVARSFSENSGQWPTREEVERLQLQFQLDEISLGHILNHSNAYPVCARPFGAVGKACQVEGKSVIVDVGMYNFARGILESDYYLYTVFPKTDVSGVLERSLLTSSLGLDVSGKSGGVSSAQAEVASRLVPSQLSFAESGEAEIEGSDGQASGEIVFGWIVGSDGVQQPVQKSQFVLLSLPAYLKRLNLVLETGWLDRDSNFEPQTAGMNMSIALPPDYEAFDTLIRGSKSHGPAIFDRLMENVEVHACRSASILIPGARLWRSSLVTLGGHQADQIIVMPDMRGIIAHFEQVPPMRGGNALLQLWTSEGSDRIDDKVRVIPYDNGECPVPHQDLLVLAADPVPAPADSVKEGDAETLDGTEADLGDD